jgi:hypothetical protein
MLQKLILENVRCFRGRHEIPLRPLTFLIGENSTGKTTLLPTAQAASGLGFLIRRNPDFNEPPFNMGAFDQIASYTRGRMGPAKRFAIGVEYQSGSGPAFRMVATFDSSAGQPNASAFEVSSGGNAVQIRRNNKGKVSMLVTSGKGVELPLPSGPEYDVGHGAEVPLDLDSVRLALQKCGRPEETPWFVELLDAIGAVDMWSMMATIMPYPIAPVRSKPERTYDPKAYSPKPEGDHVPMFLAQTALIDAAKWVGLRKRLVEFGKSSGLFSDIKIRRRLGKSGSDPFQIIVKASGASANLIDVGYGVSQILPILVDTIVNENRKVFLLQQPEVHLHPKAQAELATFLGYLAKKEKKQFLVETHSDYMIDRVCLDVRDMMKGLSPADVLILYFQRERGWVKVHPITIDANGNLVGAPKGYREFFLKEQARLFGV